MKKSRRSSQVGDVVRAELSAIISRELNDPDLGLVTVTDVEMTPDLRLARVFISTLGDEKTQSKAVAILQKSKARLRHALSQRASLRFTPELDFRLDITALRASSIEKILHEVLPEQRKPEGGDITESEEQEGESERDDHHD